jgi:hypothetical protein
MVERMEMLPFTGTRMSEVGLMARKKLAPLTLSLTIGTLALSAVPAVAATPLDGHFSGRSGGCEPGFFRCAPGTVKGFGSARWNYRFDIVGQDSRSCYEITTRARIRLTSDGSQLDLSGDGRVCFPGNSTNAPGSLVSNGNPFRATDSWKVVSGTGRFAGRTGSGTSDVHSAGNHADADYSGTLTP